MTTESALGEVVSAGYRRVEPPTNEHHEVDNPQDRAHESERPERVVKDQGADQAQQADQQPDEKESLDNSHVAPPLHTFQGTRPHFFGYVRVSTEEQGASGLGVEAQIAAIQRECAHRGWEVEIVSDIGRSGKQVNPELRRALDLLQSGQADGLIVAKLDRLARSVRNASAIIDAAQLQGWNLVLIDQSLDLATPGGRAMANMLATFAQWEAEMISSRTKDALAARKARGLDNGRKSAIPAGVLRRIVISRDAGLSFSRIAAELTQEFYLSPTGLPVWHESTVRRAYSTAKRKEGAAA